MPLAVRGDIRWYDYGPNVGRELSDQRPALIISNTELNRGLSIAIALPMSTSTPPAKHLQHHVLAAAANSWASVRQIKSVEQQRLGDKIAEATTQELEKAVEILVARLATRRITAGTVQTQFGNQIIAPGIILEVEFHNRDGSIPPTEMLILDYNNGNQMAIAVEVERRWSANSTVQIPIDTGNPSQPASALVHRVRSIDVAARTVRTKGATSLSSLTDIGQSLLPAISG